MELMMIADQQKLALISCADTGCCLEDLLRPLGMDGEIESRESVQLAHFDNDYYKE